MSSYAIVDVDEDAPSGLEFRTFLPSDTALSRSGDGAFGGVGPSSTTSAAATSRDPPSVPYSPFNIAFYAVYFDVDTITIGKRVGLALVPRQGFIADACEGQIDLYGPFWILTTLVLVLYTTSTLTSSITAYLAGSSSVSNLPLLSTATSLIYAYGLGLPALLWAATRWLGVGEWGPAEALGIYGYAMTVFIPISLLCLIPIGIVRWVLVGLGALSSGYFLVRNIYPVLASADNKMLRLFIVAVVALHAGLALAMKVLFFSYAVGTVDAGGPDPLGDQVRRAVTGVYY